MNNLVERSKQTALGKIPTEWSFKKLEDCTDKVGSGVTPKGGSKAYVESGIPLLRSQNILSGKLKLADVAFITQAQHDKMKGSKLKPGDVLLNITGASIGRCAVLPDNFDEGNVNQHVCIIRTNDLLVPSYCGFFLNSAIGQKQIWSLQAGGNREGLNFQQIKSFSMIVPPREEQQKIAEVLSTVDQKIALIDQQIAETQKLKTGLMQKLFSEGVGVQDEEGNWQPHTEFYTSPNGTIPSSWTLKPLEMLTSQKISYGIVQTGENLDAGVPCVRVVDLAKGQLQPHFMIKTSSAISEANSKTQLKFGDILFALRGDIGKVICVDETLTNCNLTRGLALIRTSDNIDPDYLMWAIRSRNLRLQISKQVNGSALKEIPLKGLRGVKAPIPKLIEQEKIASILSTVENKLNLLKKQKAETQQLKKGLMQKLLTGEWRVPLDNH